MLIVSFGLGRRRHAAHGRPQHRGGPCRWHAHPAVRLGWAGRRCRSARCASSSIVSSRASSARPANVRSPSRPCATACMFAALEEVIQRTVLDYAIQQFGLVVSDAEVRAAIARNPGLRRDRRPVRSPAVPQPPQQSPYQRAAIRHRCAPRDRSASQLFGVVRPEGLAPKSLRDDVFRMEGEKASPRRSTSPTPSSPTCPSRRPGSSAPISRPTRPASKSRSFAPSPMCC